MPRKRKPYTLQKRKIAGKKRPVFYYSINPESGVPPELCETRRSTGATSETEAIRFVLKRIEDLKAEGARQSYDAGLTLGDYAEPFYDPERCPHIARVGSNRITAKTAETMRRNLRLHVLSDPIAEKTLLHIRPADLAQMRKRILKKGLADGTVKKIMDALRVVLKEAYLNRIIPFDPATAVPRMNPAPAEAETFTVAELRQMFTFYPGHFGSKDMWMAFRLAAVLGMRRGEILALRVGDVDDGVIHIKRAWKDPKTIGLPKWEKIRDVPVPSFLADEIAFYLDDRIRVASEDLLICDEYTGERRGDTWWRKGFNRAMESADIPLAGRTPKSLRHTVATLLAERGVNSLLTGALLGHSPAELSRVQRIYTHAETFNPDSLLEALETIFVPATELAQKPHS